MRGPVPPHPAQTLAVVRAEHPSLRQLPRQLPVDSPFEQLQQPTGLNKIVLEPKAAGTDVNFLSLLQFMLPVHR